MTAKTQPMVAHGIARLHPDQEIPSSQYAWGPEWSLPPARTGRWVIDTIWNAAIRVEFDEAVPLDMLAFDTHRRLEAARRALSVEDEKRRNEWLEWADRREAAEFVRSFAVRQRREHGDVPRVAAGELVRRQHGSGVWHVATGEVVDRWRNADIVEVRLACHQDTIAVDLGRIGDGEAFERTSDDRVTVCRRCRPAVVERSGLVGAGVSV